MNHGALPKLYLFFYFMKLTKMNVTMFNACHQALLYKVVLSFYLRYFHT